MKEEKQKSYLNLNIYKKRNSRHQSPQKTNNTLLILNNNTANQNGQHMKTKQKSLIRIGCKKNITAFKAQIQEKQNEKQNTNTGFKLPSIHNGKNCQQTTKPIKRIGKNKSLPAFVQTISQQQKLIMSKKTSQLPQQKTNASLQKIIQTKQNNKQKIDQIKNVQQKQNSIPNTLNTKLGKLSTLPEQVQNQSLLGSNILSQEQITKNDSFCINVKKIYSQDKTQKEGCSDTVSAVRTNSQIMKGSFQKLINEPLTSQVESDSRIQQMLQQIQTSTKEGNNCKQSQQKKQRQSQFLLVPENKRVSSFKNKLQKQENNQEERKSIKNRKKIERQNQLIQNKLNNKIEDLINQFQRPNKQTENAKIQIKTEKEDCKIQKTGQKSPPLRKKSITKKQLKSQSKPSVIQFTKNKEVIRQTRQNKPHSDLTKSVILLNKQFSLPQIKKDRLLASHGPPKKNRSQHYQNSQDQQPKISDQIIKLFPAQKLTQDIILNSQNERKQSFISKQKQIIHDQNINKQKQKKGKLLKKQSLAARVQSNSNYNSNSNANNISNMKIIGNQDNMFNKMKNSNKRHYKNLQVSNCIVEARKITTLN